MSPTTLASTVVERPKFELPSDDVCKLDGEGNGDPDKSAVLSNAEQRIKDDGTAVLVECEVPVLTGRKTST